MSALGTRVLVALLALFGAVAVISIAFPTRARFYPLFVGGLGVILALGEVWARRRAAAGGPVHERDTDDPEHAGADVSFLAIAPYLAWLVGYLVVSGLVGFVVASGAFVTAFLHREGKVGWVRSALAGSAVVAFLVLVGQALGLHWPEALADPLRALGVIS